MRVGTAGRWTAYSIPISDKKSEGDCNSFQNEDYSLLGRDGVLIGNQLSKFRRNSASSSLSQSKALLSAYPEGGVSKLLRNTRK